LQCAPLKSHSVGPTQKGGIRGTPKARGKKAITLGDMVTIPESDIIHLFNNEAMLAVSHAIEDLASEQREGELISTFQKMKNFLPQKKRYTGLSKDLDSVRVWGEGEPPKRCGRIDFIPIFRPELFKYWIVLFSSTKVKAVLICRQVNQSEVFTEKLFAGFYSFNPFLVESVRRQFNLMSCGLDYVVNQWEKDYYFAAPPLAQINQYFQQHRAKKTSDRT
jgi:hypothetical protein